MVPSESISANVGPTEDGGRISGTAAVSAHRQILHARLRNGASGAEVMGALTEFVDGLIIGRYRNAAREEGEAAVVAGLQHCCLVALGGYGRRELAPHSDIDIMLLYRSEAKRFIEPLSRRVLHHLWDLGFKVGHSVRTINDCVDLALEDLTVRTAMMEARFLAGSPQLFQEFHRRYLRRVVSRGIDRFIDQKVAERQYEYEKFGETVYLLEPNVKKSKGGLRDLHVLQWAGMARFQAQTIQELADRGILSRPDHRALLDAREFLWRVRAFLHMQAGTAQEILTFDEQMRLAANDGFQDRPHLLAVEQFMQLYYRHTGALHDMAMRFVDRCRRGSWLHRLSRLLPAARVDGHFAVTGSSLTVPLELRSRVLEQPALLVRLFELAQSRGLRIDTDLLDEIHRHAQGLSDEAFRTPEVSRIFRKILAGPGPIAETLESMHRARLLEKVIPVFASVRGLMQFNQYHKYTVDEHSLLAVRKAETLTREPGLLQQVYREINRKDLLHLAVLLHDLGKGREEDHSDVGKAIAEETAVRLGLDEHESRTLVFLVHRHLLMAHTAFRRDPYDEKVLLTFARSVGSPEVLRKLLILTAADIAAVGPGMLTKWKESLLSELYGRALPELAGERQSPSEPERLSQVAREVAAALEASQPDPSGGPWSVSQIETELRRFPIRYIYGMAVTRIAAHLSVLRQLTVGAVNVQYLFNEELGVSEYTVLTFNNVAPGVFSKIAGVFSAQGLQILDAQIVTREDGVVVDTFQVSDPDYAGAPPMERRTTIAKTIESVLKGDADVDRLVARHTRLPVTRPFPAGGQATEVQVDNETSDRFTIIDVFADDRQGLLYVITRAIFRLGLSVHGARISTRLDQVADVFYVTNLGGARPEDPERLGSIRDTIKDEIDRFLQQGVCEQQGISSGSS